LKLCLVSSEHSPWGGIGQSLRKLAALLASRHEVTLINSGRSDSDGWPPTPPGVRELFTDPWGELASIAFSCESHQRSAAVLTAIRSAYEGTAGPDYLEFCDYLGHGLVTLQARRAGDPMLAGTLAAVRLNSSSELLALHDQVSSTELRHTAAMEREQFRLADRIVWRGGEILDLYRRYYDDLELPEANLIRQPEELPQGEELAAPPPHAGGPLRLLYVGRLQRVKGALDLVEACMRLPRDDWELTMIGADTATGPIGQSVRALIEAVCGDDPRVRIEEPLPHAELQRRWADHELLVIPSRFEVWPNVGIEAMRAGLPILATPVGGSAELVCPGETGWHSDGTGPQPLARALAELLEDREQIARVRASGAVRERLAELADPRQTLAAYDRMLDGAPAPAPAPAPSAEEPLVTGIIPYHRACAYVREAVESLLEQTYPNLDVLIVNDGSFEPGDEVLDELAVLPGVTVVTQVNRGETEARNLGAALARGEYVAMLDADNALEPRFVERAVAMLRAEPGLAYVTSWLRLVDGAGSTLTGPSAYAPLGNSVLSEDAANWDGDTIALLPRRLFAELGYGYEPECGMQSDWEFYRRLRDDGLFGAVIPEELARYRVLEDSLTKSHDELVHAASWAESRIRLRRARTRWTAVA
jgi:glycosyltransferase involved in cell wall biosynthesis